MKLVPRAEGFLIVAQTPEDGWQLGRLWECKQTASLISQARYSDDDVIEVPCICVGLNQMEAVDNELRWQGTGKGRVERIKELIQIEAQYLGSKPLDIEWMKENAPARNVVPFRGNLLQEGDDVSRT